MTLTSPMGNVLRRLEGTPGDISRYGTDLTSAARVMGTTARQLKRISEGSRQIAESVDAVREAAADTYPELEKAETRYDETGAALSTYASALESAQLSIEPLIESIGEKQGAVADAHQAETQARSDYQTQQTQIAWGADVSTADQTRLEDAYETAQGAATQAEGQLETEWGKFDRVFSTWSDAYDTAVNEIETAFVNADNNDAWGEDLLPILGWIAVGLAVVALFVTGPIALAIAAIGALVGLAMLAISLLKYDKGRGNGWELTMSIVGVLPFARPLISGAKMLRGGFSGISSMFSAGRGIVRTSVRSTLPRAAYSPFSGGLFARSGQFASNMWAGTKNAYYATASSFRSTVLLGRFRVRDLFIDRPMMNAWRGGHNSVTSLANFITSRGSSTMGNSAVQWANNAGTFAPTTFAQVMTRIETVMTAAGSVNFMVGQALSGPPQSSSA